MSERRLLLAGSFGPERVPARRDRDHADWYLPLHIRDERAARERIASQVTSGADVVVAPAWLTHRRALLPLGETRRAGTWTAAAVRVAREAVEIGLERREADLDDAPDDDLRRRRPTPLVAASLPALDDAPESATGRLLPREAATERDYRDQAGILSDAEPDLILVEGQRSDPDARTAISEAVQTGLPVVGALSIDALASVDLEDWLEWIRATGVSQLLLPAPLEARLAVVESDLRWGAAVGPQADIAQWLDHGATTIGRLDEATLPELERLRESIDAHERIGLEVEQAAAQRWLAAVGQAAAMAPGGAAVWVGPTPTISLPDGFEWLVVGGDAARQLPRDRFRLAIAASVEGVRAIAATLEPGGVLLGPAVAGLDLRTLSVDESADPPLATYRRER
jgi:hypothetical protein